MFVHLINAAITNKFSWTKTRPNITGPLSFDARTVTFKISQSACYDGHKIILRFIQNLLGLKQLSNRQNSKLVYQLFTVCAATDESALL